MDILYLLVPLSVVLAIAIGAALWWAVRNDQFEDMEGPAHRLLLDDDDRVLPQPPGQNPLAQADATPPVPVRHGGHDHPG
jgi:cbb3-type cytochrome oxidase maturation protein